MNSKGMIGLGTVVLMMVVWLLMLISTASADAHVQARAYVACGVDSFRPSHRCYIGDAPHAVFRDRVHLSRRYKVCLRGPVSGFACGHGSGVADGRR